MMTAIALDDEPLALEIIKTYCKQTQIIDLKRTFTGIKEALEYLQESTVDLMFLDINMPGMSGIDFYKTTGKEAMAIFTTAYSEYAVDGFNVSAIDYLLKPFKYSRFLHAIEKANDHFCYLQNKDKQLQYLYIRADYSMHKISLDDIRYIEGMDNYIKIHLLNSKPILVRMSMKSIVEKLPEPDFIRIHRSYIVASSKIASIRSKTVHMDTVELPIGLNYTDKIQLMMSKTEK